MCVCVGVGGCVCVCMCVCAIENAYEKHVRLLVKKYEKFEDSTFMD